MLTERLLFPAKYGNFGGNAVRIFRLIEDLRSYGHQVTLIAQSADEIVANRSVLESRVDKLILVPSIGEFRGGSLYFDCSNFYGALEDTLNDKPDIVMVEYVWMAPCLDKVGSGILKVIDTIDVMHLRKEKCKVTNPWIICSREEEIELLRKADVTLAIQCEEAQELRGMVEGCKVITVPYRQDVFRSQSSSNKVAMIVGSYNWDNIYSLQKLLEEWGKVIDVIPDAVLKVYGYLAKAVPKGARGVIPVGFQDDLSAAYAEAGVVLNPACLGTGLKIKTVEALCHGKALITTSEGSAGLKNSDGSFVVADEGFVEAVINVFKDQELRQKLERGAFHYSQKMFSKNAVYQELKDLI